MNENPPITKSEVEKEIDSPVLDNGLKEQVMKNMSPEEKLDIGNKGKEKSKKEVAKELVSFIDEQKKEITKEMTLKEKIMQSFGTAIGGQSNVYNFFSIMKDQIEKWTEFNSIKPTNTQELKNIIEDAKKDNFKGSIGTTNETPPGIFYKTGDKTKWTNESTKVME